jgi:hypothetical protein
MLDKGEIRFLVLVQASPSPPVVTPVTLAKPSQLGSIIFRLSQVLFSPLFSVTPFVYLYATKSGEQIWSTLRRISVTTAICTKALIADGSRRVSGSVQYRTRTSHRCH